MDWEDYLRPEIQRVMRYWEERERRPRIACSVCQFEYVEEDGHDCGQGQVQAT